MTQLCWGCNSHVVVFQDLVIGDGFVDDSFVMFSKSFDGSSFGELVSSGTVSRGLEISACNSVCKLLLLLGSDVVGIPGQLDASIPQAISRELSGCLLGEGVGVLPFARNPFELAAKSFKSFSKNLDLQPCPLVSEATAEAFTVIAVVQRFGIRDERRLQRAWLVQDVRQWLVGLQEVLVVATDKVHVVARLTG